MAATIKIKNSSTAGAAPTSSDLVQGELAVNVTDKRLFTENSGGTVVELGTNPSSITLPDGSASAPTLLHSGDTNTGLFFPAADTIALTTGGTERARVDSSGNLGVGVTPSAWYSGARAFQIGGGASIEARPGTANLVEFNSNAFWDASTNWTYLTSGTATQYQQYNGNHIWNSAVSGTGTITWLERMRLDSSGNLGLGVTPSAWSGVGSVLQVGSSAAIMGNSTGSASMLMNAYYNGSAYTYINTAAASRLGMTSGAFNFYTAASGTAGTAISFTQAMTLDASGNLGVGTSSPNSPAGSTQITLHVNNSTAGTSPGIHLTNGDTGTAAGDGTLIFVGNAASTGTTSLNVYNQESSPICFFTATSERARIDSSGNLLVGTTSNISAGKQCLVFNGNTQHGIEINDSSSVNASQFITFFTGGTSRGYISNNNNTAVAYNTTSDYRLKENVQPMQNALATVSQLKPVTYNWKSNGSASQGFIAHELQEVVPDAVSGEKDAVDEQGNPKYQGIDTSFLVATLTAAIQELNAKFEAYKASHP